jgi:hypothetical protein
MIDFELRVAQYVQLRDIIKQEEKEFKERIAPKKEMLATLENVLLSMLKATNQQNAKTKAGTVYRYTESSATIYDGAAFRRHVIGTEAWDLVDWRANKTAVAEFIKTTEVPPPGVNFSQMLTVGVNRPNGKA